MTITRVKVLNKKKDVNFEQFKRKICQSKIREKLGRADKLFCYISEIKSDALYYNGE